MKHVVTVTGEGWQTVVECTSAKEARQFAKPFEAQGYDVTVEKKEGTVSWQS